MSTLPRIAVVTPSYNTGRHIDAAIRSVLDQDYANFDYLVMDGGSTDNTVEVLQSFGDRLRWVSQKDNGQADAIHRGFQQTTGEILTWLNSDDTYAPGAFRAVAQFFAANPGVSLVYGNATYTDADGSLIGPCVHVEPYNSKRLFYYSDYIVQPAAFFRRSAYEAVGGVDASLHFAMDYDLWIKIAKRFKVAYLPRRLADFRWLYDNKTATGGVRRLDEIRDLVACQGFPEPAFIRLERVNLGVQEARQHLARGRIGCAIRAAAQVVRDTISHPRAMWSIVQPHTWRIIWTGQVLRARAARAQARNATEPPRVRSAPA
jgi:hypothetical protein